MKLQKIDADTKMEIIISLAFGVPIKDIAIKYNITQNKIVNLRKNNYKIYNQVAKEFFIMDEIALLGLAPIYERAINIVKKRYKNKLIILNESDFLLQGHKVNLNDLIDIADNITQKDDLPPLASMPYIKNYYWSNQKTTKRSRKCKQNL